MRNRLLLAAITLVVFAGSFLAKGFFGRVERDDVPDLRQCRRIVSMAPSITETLYALGLGDQVVGVTRFCRYPPEVKEKARVGGYLDPNFEAIVALNPDLVVTLVESQQSRSAFAKLGLSTLVVCHRNVEGILDSIADVGRYGGAEGRARQIVADCRARMDRIRRKTAGLSRPRVMVVVQRQPGRGRLEDVCVGGSDGFFDKIVRLAGGQNAYPQSTVRFPVVSVEGILWMNPQVIIDMTSGLTEGPNLRRLGYQPSLLADWQQVSEVEAVKNGRVYAIDQDYAFVPGPRFILLVEDLGRLIHPEIDWQ